MIQQAILLINMEENVNDALRFGVLPQENLFILGTFWPILTWSMT